MNPAPSLNSMYFKIYRIIAMGNINLAFLNKREGAG